jgi:hypothetical protein
MRKSLILCLAGVAALAGAQPAFAAKKTICYNHNKFLYSAVTGRCNEANHCTLTPIYGGLGFRECYQADVAPPVTGAWKGTTGLTKTFNPSTNLKSK